MICLSGLGTKSGFKQNSDLEQQHSPHICNKILVDDFVNNGRLRCCCAYKPQTAANNSATYLIARHSADVVLISFQWLFYTPYSLFSCYRQSKY